jgi:hypothetical protein
MKSCKPYLLLASLGAGGSTENAVVISQDDDPAVGFVSVISADERLAAPAPGQLARMKIG